jgi:hypothetical protein
MVFLVGGSMMVIEDDGTAAGDRWGRNDIRAGPNPPDATLGTWERILWQRLLFRRRDGALLALDPTQNHGLECY